jgi:hypothetical protein
LDKYLGALSDVGLQTIIDGEHDEAIKKVAKLHQGDRSKKKEEELLASSGSTKGKENMVTLTKKEDAKMWKLFAKKEDKASLKNDKIDATKVFVDVDGEKVPLSTLMNSVGEDFEVLQESDTVKINDKDVSIKDLVSAYKNSKSNEDEEEGKDKDKEDDKKEDDDKKDDDKKDDSKVHCFKCGKKLSDDDKKKDDGRCNDCYPKEKEDKKEDDDKKDDDKEEEEEGKEVKNKKGNKKQFFIDLENARHSKEAAVENDGPVGAQTREDKAARGKRLFGSKKKDK